MFPLLVVIMTQPHGSGIMVPCSRVDSERGRSFGAKATRGDGDGKDEQRATSLGVCMTRHAPLGSQSGAVEKGGVARFSYNFCVVFTLYSPCAHGAASIPRGGPGYQQYQQQLRSGEKFGLKQYCTYYYYIPRNRNEVQFMWKQGIQHVSVVDGWDDAVSIPWCSSCATF